MTGFRIIVHNCNYCDISEMLFFDEETCCSVLDSNEDVHDSCEHNSINEDCTLDDRLPEKSCAHDIYYLKVVIPFVVSFNNIDFSFYLNKLILTIEESLFNNLSYTSICTYIHDPPFIISGKQLIYLYRLLLL